MGFTGLALGALLAREGINAATPPDIWTPPDGQVHFAPKAKRVIWIFMIGGVSHIESFDPKPAINKYAGKTIAETPHKDVLTSSFVKDNVKPIEAGNTRHLRMNLFPLQSGYRKRG